MVKIIIKLQLCLLCCFCIAEPQKLPVSFLYISKSGWTNYHEGLLVDSSGEIRSFEFGDGDYVAGGLTEFTRELPTGLDIQLLGLSTPTGIIADNDSLMKMREIIDTVHGEKVDFGVGPQDVGIYRLSAFIYDTVNSRRKEIICYQCGTATACNSSLAARAIARYLLSVFALNISDRGYTPPDSCLNPSTIIYPFKSTARKGAYTTTSSQLYDLNGKKINRSAKQLIVGKNGTLPMDVKRRNRY